MSQPGPTLFEALTETYFAWLARRLLPYYPVPDRLPPEKPRPIVVTFLREEGTMIVVGLTFPTPAPTDLDVVKAMHTYSINGADPIVEDVISILGQRTEYKYEQNAQVAGSMIFIDDATPPNESDPMEYSFVANDQFKPTKPGEIQIEFLREE